MPFALAIGLALLQHEPEIAGMIHDLFASGRAMPTPEELADLQVRRAARVLSQQQFEADANGGDPKPPARGA